MSPLPAARRQQPLYATWSHGELAIAFRNCQLERRRLERKVNGLYDELGDMQAQRDKALRADPLFWKIWVWRADIPLLVGLGMMLGYAAALAWEWLA